MNLGILAHIDAGAILNTSHPLIVHHCAVPFVAASSTRQTNVNTLSLHGTRRVPCGCQIPRYDSFCYGDGMPTRAQNNTEELRRLYADLGCIYRREAEALKANPPKEALRRFQAESKKADAIIGRI